MHPLGSPDDETCRDPRAVRHRGIGSDGLLGRFLLWLLFPRPDVQGSQDPHQRQCWGNLSDPSGHEIRTVDLYDHSFRDSRCITSSTSWWVDCALERGCMVPFDDWSAGVTLLFVSGTYSSFRFSNWVLRLFCWFCDVPNLLFYNVPINGPKFNHSY